MLKKVFIIVLLLLCLIPTSFAISDDGENLTSYDYYFNASAMEDGDGSFEKPFKNLENNVRVHSVNYIANGEYSLSEDLLISDVSFIGEDSSKTIINCHGCVLNNSKIINLKNITLSDFTIINKGTLTAENTIFSNGYALSIDKYENSYGGAIYTPYNNTKTFTVTIDNCIFENNYAEYGGAIYMDGGILNITNSQFINNTAYNYGGAIACEYNTRLNITKTQFYNSKSINDAGGSIYLKYVNFTLNRVDIVNSTSTFGSAITALNSNLTILRLNAYNNTAKYEGGAIYQLYSSLSLQQSNFINNTARNGGGLFLDNLSSLLIAGNLFENNTALEYGGGIYSLLNPQIRFMNSFKNNNASQNPDLYETSSLNISQIGKGNYTLYVNNATFNGEIPEYYNLNDHGFVSSVKSQQYGGNCWAFASIAALESCILKAGGGELDLSEENMKNLIELYSDYGWSMETNDGGYNDMGIGYLTSWMGPVFEINDTYDDFSTLSTLLDSIMHVQNVIFLKRDNYTDNDEIKKAILQYGGVATGICYYEDYLRGNSYYYYSTLGYTNHAVTIVGWNDTYSKENFYGNPEIDGAWIVKNSWGESWGDNGYFYVSYCDKKLAQVGITESSYTFILNDTMKYDKNYQYDVIGKTNYFLNNENNIWYQNNFVADGDEILAAVSTSFEKTSFWELSVYVNDILRLTQNGSSIAGYYTIALKDYIPLKSGDKFKIIFKISGEGSFSIPISEVAYSNKFLSTNNLSFFSYDGESWHDLYTSASPSTSSIKAFTLTHKLKSNLTLTIVENQLNPVEITANVFDESGELINSGNVSFIIENEKYLLSLVNGSAKFYHNFTKGGLNNVTSEFISDVYDLSSDFRVFNVNITESYISADNLSCYFANQTEFKIKLIDEANNIITDKCVEFFINNQSYENTTDLNGFASVFLKLDIGEYDVNVSFKGDSKYIASSGSFKISVASSVLISNQTQYTLNSKFNFKIFDNNNQTDHGILFINSKEYSIKCNNSGEVNFNINLANGNYLFKVINPISNESKSLNIKVVSRISDNKDISLYFGAKYNYKVRIYDDFGNPAKSGEIVSFTISGKPYKTTSDNLGYCYLPISVNVGSHTIKIQYKGFEVSNKIIVKKTLISKDKTIKKGKTLKFQVKLLNSNGKIQKGKKITFKIKNKKYTAKTNKKGIATVKIGKLKVGKYVITSSFSNVKVKNRITVKK